MFNNADIVYKAKIISLTWVGWGMQSWLWVRECVRGYVSECVSVSIQMSVWLSVWVCDWVCEWMCECVTECVSAWLKECMTEYMSVRVRVCLCVREEVHEWEYEWVSKWTHQCVSEWTSAWVSLWVSMWGCECMCECTREWVSGWLRTLGSPVKFSFPSVSPWALLHTDWFYGRAVTVAAYNLLQDEGDMAERRLSGYSSCCANMETWVPIPAPHREAMHGHGCL